MPQSIFGSSGSHSAPFSTCKCTTKCKRTTLGARTFLRRPFSSHVSHGYSHFRCGVHPFVRSHFTLAPLHSCNPHNRYKDQFFNAVMAFVAEAKGSSVVARAGLLLCSAWVEHTPPARGFNAVYYKIYKGLGAIPIRSDDLDTQEAAVKLINAVIGKATTALRPEVFAKLEKLDVKGALANRVHGQVSLTLAHELSVLQTHLLSEKAERAQYMFSQHDKDCVGKLATLKDGLAQFQDDVRAGASYNAALGCAPPPLVHTVPICMQ